MPTIKLLLLLLLPFFFNCAWLLGYTTHYLDVNITVFNTRETTILVKEKQFSGRIYPFFVDSGKKATEIISYEHTSHQKSFPVEETEIILAIYTVDLNGAFTKCLMEKNIVALIPDSIAGQDEFDFTYKDTVTVQ